MIPAAVRTYIKLLSRIPKGGQDAHAVYFRDVFFFCFSRCFLFRCGIVGGAGFQFVKMLLYSLAGGTRGRRNATRVGRCSSALYEP